MAKWHGYLGGGATGVAVVVAGYLVWSFLAARDASEAPKAPGAVPATPENVTILDSRAETAAATQEDVDEPQSAAARAPQFDLVRIEPDGSALIAGAGGAGAAVVIYLDGEAIGEATAGGDGRFVSLLDIPPAAQPRLMTLATRQAGAETFSEAEIIISPFGSDPAEIAMAKSAGSEPAPARGAEPGRRRGRGDDGRTGHRGHGGRDAATGRGRTGSGRGL